MDDTTSSKDAGDLTGMRRDYRIAELDESAMPSDPMLQFQTWFREACESGVTEPNAMSVATAAPDGRTSIRTVLCKGYGQEGFVFYTNLKSTKATQIAANASVSLLFPWLKLERQVIINGVATKLAVSQVAKYFLSRPVDSQIAAWASEQSHFTTRSLLRRKFGELREKFAGGAIPVPEFWGGFVVQPRTIEFWQGRPSRMHDRLLYTREDNGTWTIGRLSP